MLLLDPIAVAAMPDTVLDSPMADAALAFTILALPKAVLLFALLNSLLLPIATAPCDVLMSLSLPKAVL